MTKTVTIKGYVYEADYGTREGKHYSLYHSDRQADQWNTLVGPAEFQFTLPDGFNPTKAKLDALEKEKQKVRAAYLSRVKEIEEQISNLQALEMMVETEERQ